MSGGTRSYEMALRFVKAGHEVHILSSCRDSKSTHKNWWIEMVDGINVHWLTVPYSNKLSYSRRIAAFVRFAWEAGKKASKIGGDIVFATSTPLTIALPGVYASKRLGIPMVFEVRDLWPELPIAVGALKNPLLITLAKWLEKFAYNHADHIVTLSPGMAEGVRTLGQPDDKISIIPNGADITLFQKGVTPKNSFLSEYPEFTGHTLVIYAGTLGIINGVDYLLDIANEMKIIDPDVQFLIVGDGKELASIKNKANEEGLLSENLMILPPVAKKEMPDLLAAATVATSLFVDLPEMWNNSANKFFDALAAAKPVMINYQGWQARLLEESGAGIVVPPDCPQKAAGILHGFLRDTQRVKDAEIASRYLAETCFNRDILAAQLLAVLEKVVNL